jgi:hypothetical protein
MPSDSTPPLSASGQDEHAVPEDESDAAEGAVNTGSSCMAASRRPKHRRSLGLA